MRSRPRDARFPSIRLAEALLTCVLMVALDSLAVAQADPHLETDEIDGRGPAQSEAASAEEGDPYQALVAAAVRAYRGGALVEAREHFSRAHALSPSARTLRGLGVVAFELKQYRQAVDYLEQSLSSQIKPLDEPLRKSAEELLRSALRHVGRFHLLLRPEGTALWLDGARVELASGVELLIEQGQHRLEFRHPGYVTEQRRLEVHGREDAVLEVSLRQPAPDLSEKRVMAATTRKRWWKSPWLWSAVGVAVVGGVAATAVLARSDGRHYDGGSTDRVAGR